MEGNKLEASDLSTQQLQDLQGVLSTFEEVFGIPNELPPLMEHDHQIPLIPGTKPPSIRPYHYGPLQKSEIEKVVQELLDGGLIKPSHIPFSFSMLLVKKKDGT